MALTTEQNAALVEELKLSIYDGKTSADGIDILHNGVATVTTNQVPKPLTLTGLMGLLSAESRLKVLKFPSFTDVRDKIQSQDREAVGLYAQAMAGDIVTTEEAGAILASLIETEADIVTTRDVPRIQTQFQSVQSERTIGEGESARVEQFGFPNVVEQSSFNAAWLSAGRSL